MKSNWETTEFIRTIKITQEDYDFINAQKFKKSAAGFLKMIIAEYRKPNLFKKKK